MVGFGAAIRDNAAKSCAPITLMLSANLACIATATST